MPIAINPNRPPSANTVPGGGPNGGGGAGGGGGGAAPRTTTTSRRGGRTRSRSPPVMGGRLSATEGMGPPPAGGGGGGENPSSAAAAAAAAAKAFSSSGGSRRSAWADPGGQPPDDYRHHGGGGYDKPYGPPGGGSSSRWPDDGHGQYGGQSRGGPPSRYPPPGGGYGEPPSYRPSEPQPGGGYHHGPHGPYRGDMGRGPPSHHPYDDMRRHSRGGPHSGHYQPDYRYSSSSGRSGERSRGGHPGQPPPPSGHSKPSSSSRSGTSLVIGGTTPIHVPKTSDPGMDRRASAASVFRGRPDGDPLPAPQHSEDSPQKILLSLRTPSNSFEEKGTDDAYGKPGKSRGLSPSPEEPPQIHNSHHRRGTDKAFDPQRSSEGNKSSGPIEMTPSFTLFNQSFDSFGDSHYFNVDSTLQNDSFGMVRTGSGDNNEGNQLLQRNPSASNFSHQFLAPSGSLTIGYSPVNSFGNVSAPPRRPGNNITILGGPDQRASSPMQVLGIYRTGSSGGPGIGPRVGSMDEGPLHTSVGGSFGAQSFNRSFNNDPTTSPHYYPGPARSHESADRPPPFYAFLRKYKGAFKDCTFLLPGLKAALLEAPSTERSPSSGGDPPAAVEGGPQPSFQPSNQHTPYRTPSGHSVEPSPQDIAVARRRVECSVCAFGGSLNHDRSYQAQDSNTGRSSIFRGQEQTDGENTTATVTPSSTTSPSASRCQSRSRRKYEEALPGRYYENESRLSWEFEENPPIEAPGEDDGDGDKSERGTSPKNDSGDNKDDKSKSDSDSYCQQVGEGDSTGKRPSSASPQPKMRYRCKLCGQPKQNHRCPYQQSLARSIGVTVYPAVNAFTADEPGTIATPLSEMNNFIDVKESHSNESSPNRPTPERARRITGPMSATTQVTPESMIFSSRQIGSPASMIGSPSGRSGRGRVNRPKKRLFSQVGGGTDEQGDLLFIEAMELRPEQFRIVSKSRKTKDTFSYPALPLPYAQRKRLSDNLFSLSNEVPKLTDECAQVLREAREKEMWDLAVSELMTQVIVIIHCPDGDNRFEGLRQYLLTLGIAC